MAAWIIAKCESSGIVFVPAPPKENAHLPPGYEKQLLSEAGQEEKFLSPATHGAKLGKVRKAEKKVARAAAAESARASVVVPERKGGMLDVRMATPNLEVKCPHSHRYGEPCYKCDPKMGIPNFPEAENAV